MISHIDDNNNNLNHFITQFSFCYLFGFLLDQENIYIYIYVIIFFGKRSVYQKMQIKEW
jgi:hypothetical protein